MFPIVSLAATAVLYVIAARYGDALGPEERKYLLFGLPVLMVVSVKAVIDEVARRLGDRAEKAPAVVRFLTFAAAGCVLAHDMGCLTEMKMARSHYLVNGVRVQLSSAGGWRMKPDAPAWIREVKEADERFVTGAPARWLLSDATKARAGEDIRYLDSLLANDGVVPAAAPADRAGPMDAFLSAFGDLQAGAEFVAEVDRERQRGLTLRLLPEHLFLAVLDVRSSRDQ